MKRVLMMGAAVTLSAMLAGAAIAQEADKPDAPRREGRGEGGDRPGREEMRERMLKEFDADKDGKLNDEEREKAREARQGRMGREGGPGEGRPPRGEGRGPEGRRGPGPGGHDGPGPGGPPPHGPGFPPNPMRLFNAFDADKNEQLSKDEFEKLMGKLRELMPPPPRFRGPGGPDGPGPGPGRPGFGEGRRRGPEGPGGPEGRGPRGDGEGRRDRRGADGDQEKRRPDADQDRPEQGKGEEKSGDETT
jgi:hypothetical protein